MSGAAKKSSKTKSKTPNKINCCECINPSDKGVPKYTQPLCTTIDPLYHINGDLSELQNQLQNNLHFMLDFLKANNIWNDGIFDWTNATLNSPLLNVMFKILDSIPLDKQNEAFLNIMIKAVLTDQDHDFLSGDERTKFDETMCSELAAGVSIIGLRKCLTRPKSQDSLTIDGVIEFNHGNLLHQTKKPDPNKKLEGIEYMISDTAPPKLLNVIEDIKEIYTITSYIDSASCSSKNMHSFNLCPHYKISNNIEYIITNLAFAFYQSFFKILNEFSLYIECSGNCNTEYNNLLHGTKVFTIIIKHTASGNTHKFEGLGGAEGDFTVRRIIRTLAVCNVLCPKIINLIDWLTNMCAIKDPSKIKKIIINLKVLMKGFGDFCQMFICLFFYFVKINIGIDAAGKQKICSFNNNIILTTCDSYLAQIALLCNCPHIIGHCTDENHRWIYIDSNSIYLGKTLYRCWNDFYSIQLIVGNDTHDGTDRRIRQLVNTNTFNESCFCYEYGDKAIDKDVFFSNLTKHFVSYQKQLVLFEKEFAILHQTNSKTFVLYLTPEDIRLRKLEDINTIYSNRPTHSLSSDKRITFTFAVDYNLATVYDDTNIPEFRPIISSLYEFIELVLTIHSICKFYEQVFTTKINNIVYTNNKKTQVKLLNNSSIPNVIEKSKIKADLKTADDIINDKLVALTQISFSSSRKDKEEILPINFISFKEILDKNKSKPLDQNKFLKTKLLDPLIAWAKLKPFNPENVDEGFKSNYKDYYDNTKFANNNVQLLKNIYAFLNLTASMITMYRELLTTMKTLKQRYSAIKSKDTYRSVDDKNILDTDEANLKKYIDELKAKIASLQEKYNGLKSEGYIALITEAQQEYELIIEYLNDPNNIAAFKDDIKEFLLGFVGNNNKLGILGKSLPSVFKSLLTNIAIITTNCGDECGKVCVLDGAPGGPLPSLQDSASTGALAGGHIKNIKRLKRTKAPFKGGFILSESSPELLNLCENYELQKTYDRFLVVNDLSLLYSDEFTNLLLNNYVLATFNSTTVSTSTIGVIFKNYVNRLLYNYFAYILILTFTRNMETNLAKFIHFVDCYRLLVIEKNRFVGNIVNLTAYYLSKNSGTIAYAEPLRDALKIYESRDLSILDYYQKIIEFQTQRILDFPYLFNKFLKTNLDLRSAFVEHDRLLSQSGDHDAEGVLYTMVPVYIELFTNSFPMIYGYVSEYVNNYQPDLHENENNIHDKIDSVIESILEPIIKSKHSKLITLNIQSKELKSDINKLDTKIRSMSLRKKRSVNLDSMKERARERHSDDKERDSIPQRKRESKTSNDLEKLKTTKSDILDILIHEIQSLKEDLQDATNLYSLCRKLTPELEKYSRLNTSIHELYWRPDATYPIEVFQERHVITPQVVINICHHFNNIITELTKQNKKTALLTSISKIDTKITNLKTEVSRPKNTQRARETAQEREREQGREGEGREGEGRERRSSRDKRRSRRSRGSRSRSRSRGRNSGTDNIKVELKKLKDLKQTKLSEFSRMNGGVSIIDRKTIKNKPKTIENSALFKYKLRVEQYKNKKLSSYFEKKLRTHINDNTVDIYTIGLRKMKELLKKIYNIPK